MSINTKVFNGDCLNVLKNISDASIDLIYLDPPFFSQKEHKLCTKDGNKEFYFNDTWVDDNSYANFLLDRIILMKNVLKNTGSIFFHCDKSASHIIRLLLDKVFGKENFQSEIIWYYKRWSNSKKGLLPAHQTIFFYSKTSNFKFNQVFCKYSETTNIDQIMQKRVRDTRNKSVYAKENGEIANCGAKKGVPLSDVWEIPFLNPKAKERVDYPTQKPVLLLSEIIKLVTDEGDIVLDPFCGSGTTLVSAKSLERNSIGIDISDDAVSLSKERLNNPIITQSMLIKNGKHSYVNHAEQASKHLSGIEYLPVQRNKGIDGLLKEQINNLPTFVRVQKDNENILDTIQLLQRASKNKGKCHLLIVETKANNENYELQDNMSIIQSTASSLKNLVPKNT